MILWFNYVSALKLIDNATLFSKEEVLKEYELNKNAENLDDLLYEKSVYPNGEKLGFYNTSKFNLNDFSAQNFSIENFKEYLSGFSIEIQELINIMRLIIEHNYADFVDKVDDIKKYFSRDEKFLISKEDIQKKIIDLFYYNKDTTYYNYEEYSNFLTDILFYNADFKESISILYINPDNYLIFQLLNYLEKNVKCNVNLNVISNSLEYTFPLKFLSIINKTNVKFIFDEEVNSETNTFDLYNKLFDYNTTFDFIIQSDTESKRGYISKDEILSNYNLTVSSRVIYSFHFGMNYIDKEWLEKDILEALIVIPIKKDFKVFQKDTYDSSLLIILNYNKPIERKNKVIIIDNTKNKDISSSEFVRSEYRNLINIENVYTKSFNQFSKFLDSDTSKIVSNDEIFLHDAQILNQKFRQHDKNVRKLIIKYNYEMFSKQAIINISDFLYEGKMVSQKNYLKINSLEKNSKDKDCIISEQLDYEIEELGNLVKEASFEGIKSNDPKTNLYFYINESLVNQWVFFDFEINNPRLFERMELISSKLSLEYLYYFLNSEMGINEYEYFMRGNSHTKYPFFNKIRVLIPPREIQDKIVDAMNKSTNFFNEVNQLKKVIDRNFFNYELNSSTIDEFYGNRNYSEETLEVNISNSWEYTLSGLVWPLAITYLLATSGGFEKVETANNLLKLFEFTTAFNAIVLISALPEHIYEEYKTRIWDYAYDKRNNGEKFNKSLKLSFGSWVAFNNTLSGIYKKEFSTELNKEFYIKLLNKEIRKYYNNLKDERNDEFHGSITNAYEAEILINELNIPKAKVFEYLNSCYNNFKLYYITGRHNLKNNEYEVIFLNGAYSMPIYSTVIYDGLLEPESLYLHDVVENTFSKLNNNLIKFEAIDETKHDWRLYIFTGFETIDNTKKAIYKCYQRKEKKDREEDIDLNDIM